MANRDFTHKILAFLFTLTLWVAANDTVAQEAITHSTDSVITETLRTDSLTMDSIYSELTLSPDSSRAALKRNSSYNTEPNIKKFRPDPTKATWIALVIPGGGQIYNRKYWKLPIVYGGFVGCLYAYNWNNQMYKDYRQAYLDIMDSDPNSNSYENFFRPGYDFEKNKDYLTETFKKRKDRYRRWRDLSVFAFIGVYVLSVIDAYVDAQLSSFDISDNLNITVEPEIKHNSLVHTSNNYYGINCNINF